MSFKTEINNHLKAHDRFDLIDSYWVDEAVYILTKLPILKKKIDDLKLEGMVQIAKTGYTQKTGYMATYESLIKTFVSISIKLGLSPKDREKWVKQKPTRKTKDDDLIK